MALLLPTIVATPYNSSSNGADTKDQARTGQGPRFLVYTAASVSRTMRAHHALALCMLLCSRRAVGLILPRDVWSKLERGGVHVERDFIPESLTSRLRTDAISLHQLNRFSVDGTRAPALPPCCACGRSAQEGSDDVRTKHTQKSRAARANNSNAQGCTKRTSRRRTRSSTSRSTVRPSAPTRGRARSATRRRGATSRCACARCGSRCCAIA